MKAIWLSGFAVKSRQRIFPIFSAYVSRCQNTWRVTISSFSQYVIRPTGPVWYKAINQSLVY